MVGVHGESWTDHDQISKLRQADSLVRVTFEDASQDDSQFWGQGQDGTQEVGVFEKGSEGRIFRRGLLPGIAATSKVHQDYAKTPDIVGCRSVAGVRA